MNEYGKALRAARGGKTLSDVASFLDVSISYVSDVERGHRRPFGDDRTLRLARYLEVSAADLMVAAARDRGYVALPTEGRTPAEIRSAVEWALTWMRKGDKR